MTTYARILATAPLLFFIPTAYIVVKEATQIGDAAKALAAKLAKEPKPQSIGMSACNLRFTRTQSKKAYLPNLVRRMAHLPIINVLIKVPI